MKPFSSLLITLTSLITFNVPVLSQPITPANDGTGTMVNHQGNQYNITGGSESGDGSNLFHSFSEFGLNNGQIANFLTNPQIQNVLSRVVGGNPSVINGLIQLSGSNANLFLMNPSGIVFGQGASLNVPASFTATTATGIGFNNGWFNLLGTADYNNLVGNPTGFAFSHTQPGIILNAADLSVTTGNQLTLAGGLVINNGNLSAAGGNINIIAVEGGNWVRITPQGSLLSVEVPIPQDGQGNFQSLTVADLPTLLTTIPSSESGVAINSSGEAILSQTNTVIPTEGGTGIVSGNLNADGLNNSNGGNVIIYGNDRLEFYGFASARGGLNGGDGGFIETSGKNSIIVQGNVDASAVLGSAGTWLIDPTNITIVSGDLGNIGESSVGVDNINNTLNGGTNVTIATNIGGTEEGNITQNANAIINWTTTNSLTLDADNNIILNGAITGNGELILNSNGVTLINNLIQVDSLVTDVEGTTQLNSNVTTIGNQTYNDAVILLQDTSLSGNDLTFNSTIDSDGTPRSLTLTTTGATNIINSGIDFSDTVGGNSPLRELVTNTPSSFFGATFILDDLSIITTEDQDYSNSRITISGDQQQSTFPITATFIADSDNNGIGDFIAQDIDGFGHNLNITAANVDVSGTIDLEGLSGGTSTPSPLLDGGNLDITATTGNITSTLIITRGDFEKGDPPNLLSNGGNVTLSAENGNIQVYYIDARGQRDGIGGTVDITTGNFFRAIGIIEQLSPNDPNPTQSIYTAGGAGGGSITIRHGGNGVTPFIVGDATTNGTNGTLDSGSFNIDSGSFLYTTVVGDISIISVDEPSEPPIVDPPVVEPPVVEPPVVEPPVVEPPVVEPPVVEPSVVEPPVVEPPVVEPPEPPVVEPPVVEPPVDEPSVVEPPVVENNRPTIPNDLNIVLTGNENDVSGGEQSKEEENNLPERPSGSIAYNPNQFSIFTLEQVRDILSLLTANTDEKPALVYVSFSVPEITPRPLTDQELAQKEAKLTNEYADFLNLDKRDPNLVLSIEPSDNYELELVLITQDEKPFRVQLSGVTRQKVLEKAESLYNEVYNLGDNYRDPASELYQWIFASLEDELEKRKVENILFFLPSGMRLLPLSALYDPNQQEYVAEKDYTVGVAPSVNLLDYRYQPLNQAPVLAFGASEFAPEEQQTPLPGVGVEVPLITEQIRQGNAFINQAFTLDQFQNRQANTYPIVHLATHADFLIEAPKQSYIQLYDSKLRLAEWRKLNLDNPTVDLLVISACKTAYGNAEVELGFGGLAVQAGVKTVIASLWEVGDVGTIGLMSEFYESLEDTSTKARALQLAQQAMIKGEVYKGDNYIMTSVGQIPLPNPDIAFKEDLAHPYYWAAFTLIGSPW